MRDARLGCLLTLAACVEAGIAATPSRVVPMSSCPLLRRRARSCGVGKHLPRLTGRAAAFQNEGGVAWRRRRRQSEWRVGACFGIIISRKEPPFTPPHRRHRHVADVPCPGRHQSPLDNHCEWRGPRRRTLTHMTRAVHRGVGSKMRQPGGDAAVVLQWSVRTPTLASCPPRAR